jgi:hypothetical protein
MDDGIVQKNSEKTMANSDNDKKQGVSYESGAQMSGAFVWQALLILLSFSFSFTFLILPLLRSFVSDEVMLVEAGLMDDPSVDPSWFEDILMDIVEGWDEPPQLLNNTNTTETSQLIEAALTSIPPVINAGATFFGQPLFALAVLMGAAYGAYEKLTATVDLLKKKQGLLDEVGKNLSVEQVEKILSDLSQDLPASVTTTCKGLLSTLKSADIGSENKNKAQYRLKCTIIESIKKLIGSKEADKKEKRLEIVAFLRHGLVSAAVLSVVTEMTLYSCRSYLPWLTDVDSVITLAKNYIKMYALSMPAYMFRTLLEQFIFVFGLVHFATGGAVASLAGGSFIAYGASQLLGLAGMGLGFGCEEWITAGYYLFLLKRHKFAKQIGLFDFKDIKIGYWQQLKKIFSYMFTIFPAVLADLGAPLFYSAAMGGLGASVLARYNSAMDIIVLTNNIALATSIAQSIGLSKLIGQKDIKGVRRYFFSSMLTMMGVSLVTTAAGVIYIYNRDEDALIFPNAIGASLDMMVIHFATVLRCLNFRSLPHVANGILATVPWLGVAAVFTLKRFDPNVIDEYVISEIYMGTEALTLLPLIILSCKVTDEAYLKKQMLQVKVVTEEKGQAAESKKQDNAELLNVIAGNGFECDNDSLTSVIASDDDMLNGLVDEGGYQQPPTQAIQPLTAQDNVDDAKNKNAKSKEWNCRQKIKDSVNWLTCRLWCKPKEQVWEKPFKVMASESLIDPCSNARSANWG